MQFLFNNETNYYINENIITLIKNVILETLIFENFPTNVEISFSIVSSYDIRQLNKIHRNIDKETDVLSFPLIDDFYSIKNNSLYPIPLGDIIINIEKAITQAKEYGHSFEREISFLTVHSMLHLLGYDHIVENEEKIMFKKQDDILNNLGISR